jgi:uncharacterized membrane protein (DUF485 family)
MLQCTLNPTTTKKLEKHDTWASPLALIFLLAYFKLFYVTEYLEKKLTSDNSMQKVQTGVNQGLDSSNLWSLRGEKISRKSLKVVAIDSWV